MRLSGCAPSRTPSSRPGRRSIDQRGNRLSCRRSRGMATTTAPCTRPASIAKETPATHPNMRGTTRTKNKQSGCASSMTTVGILSICGEVQCWNFPPQVGSQRGSGQTAGDCRQGGGVCFRRGIAWSHSAVVAA
jgi:hypothetical protein